MRVRIRGESGRISVDRVARMAVVMLVDLVRCHCFM